MTAPTLTRSAYPKTVDELIPHARDLAAQLGEVPSRNKLMKTFRVGADKANALRDALTATPNTATPAPAPANPPSTPGIGDDQGDADRQSAGPVAGFVVRDGMPKLLTGPAATDLTTPPTTVADPPADPAAASAAWPDPAAAPPPATALITDTATAPATARVRRPVTWPVLILCLPAFVAIWGGWVEMGRLTGFGKVALLPGVADSVVIDTAITLPIGVETYAAYALYVWLSGRATGDARTFAKWSALASLALGAAGQVAYHLMAAAGWTAAPWPITAAVACIPVAVLGMGAALAHLMHQSR